MKILALVALAAMLAACDGTSPIVGQPLLQDGAKSFSQGSSGVDTALKQLTQNATRDKRMQIASLTLAAQDSGKRIPSAPPPSQPAALQSFADFACAGIDDYAAQAAVAAALASNAKILDGYTAEPSGKLTADIASIRQYTAKAPDFTGVSPAGGASATGSKQWQNCDGFVRNKFPEYLKPQAPKDLFLIASAVGAVVDAIKKLVDDAQAAMTVVADEIDRGVRAAALKKKLQEDSDTQKKMATILGPCLFAPDGKTRLEKIEDVNACLEDPARASPNDPMSNASLAKIFYQHEAATLFVAYYEYRALQDLPRGTFAQRAHAMEGAALIHANLADFDAIRTQAPPKDVLAGTIVAWNKLTRIASGNLTKAEEEQAYLAALKRYAAEMKAIVSDGQTLKKDIQDTSAAVQKVPF